VIEGINFGGAKKKATKKETAEAAE